MTLTHEGPESDEIIPSSEAADDVGTTGRILAVRRAAHTFSASRWTYALVIAWAAGSRLLSAAIDHVPAYYYPDSWSYVVRSRSISSLHPFHSPEVWRVWSTLIPGVPSERSVMALQFVFGVAGAVIVHHLLRRWGTSIWMLALALLYGCLPLMIFADRSVLSESATIFFWLLMTLGLDTAIRSRNVAVRLASIAGAGVATGVSIALRPATRYMVLTTAVLALAGVAATTWRRHGRWTLRVGEFVAAAALFVIFALPVPMRLMSDNEATWGTSTLTPGAGTVLAARWSVLIDCGPFEGMLPATREALTEICQVPGQPRRDHSDLIWKSGPFGATLRPGPDFARIQSELSAATRTAVLQHPGLAAANVLDRLRQFYFAMYDDYWAFHNGSGWINSPQVRAHFKDFHHWFAGATSRTALDGRVTLIKVVDSTMFLPFVLTTALLVLLCRVAGRVARGAGRRRRLRLLLEHPGVPSLIVVTGTFVVGVASVAAGGVADFRYWAPILPSLVLSVGGAISLQGFLVHLEPTTITSDDTGNDNNTADDSTSVDGTAAD